MLGKCRNLLIIIIFMFLSMGFAMLIEVLNYILCSSCPVFSYMRVGKITRKLRLIEGIML